MLAEITGDELFRIVQDVPYSDGYQPCIAEAKHDLQKNARPGLVSMSEGIDDYDEIYVCPEAA